MTSSQRILVFAELIRKYKKFSPAEKRLLLSSLSTECVKFFVELIINCGKFKLSSKAVKALKAHRSVIKILVDKKHSLVRRKKVILKAGKPFVKVSNKKCVFQTIAKQPVLSSRPTTIYFATLRARNDR